MIILALDTTAKTSTAAITDGEKLIALSVINTKNTHSQTLLPSIDSLLKNSSVSLRDIDVFACSAGPGSFTGVRIGVSTLKGLAYAENKPCVGVSSLRALAENLSFCEGIISPVMDARRNQLYNALFRCENGSITRICEDRVISAEDLHSELLETEGYEKILFNGDGVYLMKDKLTSLKAEISPELLVYQNAYSVAVCAKKEYEKNSTKDYGSEFLHPVYLRVSQAERERVERLGSKESL